MAKKDDTILIADESGVYMLKSSVWKQHATKIEDKAAIGVVDELTRFGTYIAYIPPEFAVGFGTCCTLVNLKLILQS